MTDSSLKSQIINNDIFRYLDEKWKETVSLDSRSDKSEFRYYESLVPKDFKPHGEFLCLKNNKTKILYLSNDVITYLNDAHIIKHLISLDNKYFDRIYQAITNICNENFSDLQSFNFILGSQEFTGLGLPYEKNDFTFLLYSDCKLGINDFLFILNMIIFKDLLFSVQLDNNWYKRTFGKYKMLIDLYRFKDNTVREILKAERYPVDEPIDIVFFDKKRTVTINKIFEKLIQI